MPHGVLPADLCPLPQNPTELTLTGPCTAGSESQAVLLLVTGGRGLLGAGEARLGYAAGELLLVAEGPVALWPERPGGATLLELGSCGQLVAALGGGRPLWSAAGDDGLLRQAEALLQRMGRWGSPHEASAALYGLLMALAERAADPLASLPPLARQAAELMERSYARLSGVEELAERLGVSKSHLIRTFTAALGASPGRYLQRVRIEQARRLLERLDEPLETVAALVGFAEANYFCRVFRREVGLSPGRYRAQRRVVLPMEPEQRRQLDEFYLL